MPFLWLLRHAKSSWNEPALDDHQRPLAERGERAAALMGVWCRQRLVAPERVVCSTALRTRQTLERVRPGLGDPEVRYDGRVYGAGVEQLRTVLSEQGAGSHGLLLVGHNPGLQELALDSLGVVSTDLATQLAQKFPTGALATLEVPGWDSLDGGRLLDFRVPKELV